MSKLTFRTLHNQLMKLYFDKEYPQALEQLEREQAYFPENTAEIAYWHLCLGALLGRQAEALRVFKEALNGGFWFSPETLLRDPDLVSLRSLPEFQQMVEICRERLAAAQSLAKPALLVRKPTEQAGALPLLCALHGNGENASITIDDWRDIIAQGWLLAAPQSSQLNDPATFVWNDRETGISEVRAHIAALNGEYTIDPQRVVLGGFSMGAGQAVWMALHQSVPARGFIVLGPYLTPDELDALPTLLTSQRSTSLRGSILVGELDVECLEVARKIVEIMQAHHLPCELTILPGIGHYYPPDFGEFIRKGLAFIEAV